MLTTIGRATTGADISNTEERILWRVNGHCQILGPDAGAELCHPAANCSNVASQTPVFDRLPFSATLRWRLNVPRNNQQKEANDSGIISDREVWSAIRYLDPESNHRKNDIAAAITVLAVVCMVVVMLYLHGL
jgi:hypothetical protein